MRILIAPAILHQKTDAAWHLTKNLSTLLSHEHAVAVNAPQNLSIPDISLYTSVSPVLPFFHNSHKKAPSYEEWLAKNGCLNEKYLNADLDNLLHTIDSFQPDLIISILRPMAVTAASIKHIRCFTYVHPAMYRRRAFPTEIIYPLNQVLSSHDQIQVISLKDLSWQADLRFGFGPAQIMPFLKENDVLRIGSQMVNPSRTVLTNRVCIFLNDVKKSPKQMKQMIIDAFHGAPYAVYASFQGSEDTIEENIHFLAQPNTELIPGSIAVIHDGNDYYSNICLTRGIVQVIIANHDFIRRYNGQAIKRYKTGFLLYEEDLTMESLYSSYRTILSDDEYDINAKAVQKQIVNDGDLTRLIHFL